MLRVLTSDRDAGYHRVIYDTLVDRVADAVLDRAILHDHPALDAVVPRFDVLHLHWPEWWLGPDVAVHDGVIAVLERAGVPIVWTQHNLVPHAKHPGMDAVYQRWAAAAHGVVHHSLWGQARARERYAYRGDAVHRVIPHPHFGPLIVGDPPARREVELALGLGHGVLRLAVIGAPRVEKDVQLAMRALVACRRSDVELVVYSLRRGEVVPSDRRLVAEPYERVWRSDYDTRLRVADALVMPFEPGEMLTTGTVGDAVGHGLPCLVSEWQFLDETLGEGGIRYGRTAEDLAAAIDALSEDRLARARTAVVSLRETMDPRRVGRMTLSLLDAVRARAVAG